VALLAKSQCRYGHLERLGAHARPQSAMVPPSKTPKFMPSQKPIAMAAAIVIVSPLRGACYYQVTTALTFLPMSE
jgi:hypothetical protein